MKRPHDRDDLLGLVPFRDHLSIRLPHERFADEVLARASEAGPPPALSGPVPVASRPGGNCDRWCCARSVAPSMSRSPVLPCSSRSARRSRPAPRSVPGPSPCSCSAFRGSARVSAFGPSPLAQFFFDILEGEEDVGGKVDELDPRVVLLGPQECLILGTVSGEWIDHGPNRAAYPCMPGSRSGVSSPFRVMCGTSSAASDNPSTRTTLGRTSSRYRRRCHAPAGDRCLTPNT